MKKELLYDNLLNAIKEEFPQKTNLVNALVDLLCIEKEAVYRRLRGEVAFTFAEIVTIAMHLEYHWITWSVQLLRKAGRSN